MLRVILTCTVAALVAAQQPVVGQPAPVAPELSPGVSWEPHGPFTRAVGLRRLNAAELKIAKERYDAFYRAFVASAHFRTPIVASRLVASAATIDAPSASNGARGPVLLQGILPYWSAPRDVRRLPNGVLTPKLGGAHDLIYFELNAVPRADVLEDRATYGDYSRGVITESPTGYFAMPKELGTLGGGVVFSDQLVFTRDGRSVLAPAPLGPLLDIEIARLESIVKMNAEVERDRLAQAEASLAPDKVEERRAKRAAIWGRETPAPAVLAKRLADAHASDVAEVERVRRDVAPLAVPNPKHRTSGAQLALATLQRLAASLDAAGRAQPACARTDRDFLTNLAVRFEPVGSTPDCVPMVRIRDDLLDPKRPLTEVQVMSVFFRGSRCGEVLSGQKPLQPLGRCGFAVPLLREMDWAIVRGALAWPQ